jgi:uncharacterized protein YndB with AHSA1/START domain
MGPHLTVRESIAVPPEQVLAALTDYDRLGEWMSNLVVSEKLIEGPLRVGSRWRQTRRRFGEVATDVNEVVRLEPPHRYDVHMVSTRGQNVRADYLFSFRLEPQGGGTEITVVLEGETTGMDYGPSQEMLSHTVAALVAVDLAALKRYLERGVGGGGGSAPPVSRPT